MADLLQPITEAIAQPIILSINDAYTDTEYLTLIIAKINELAEVVNTLNFDFDSKEDSSNITLARKLSENGDFTGTWFGVAKTVIDNLIENNSIAIGENNDLIQLKEDSLSITNLRLLSALGDFTGKWFGETKASLDARIKNGDFTGTWQGQTYSDIINLISNGDFTGTWDGQTKAENDLVITGIDTSYQSIIDMLNQNANSFITIADFGFVSATVTETIDLGNVIDPVDTDRDLGLIKYPCQC